MCAPGVVAWAGDPLPAHCCVPCDGSSHATVADHVVHDGTTCDGVVLEDVAGHAETPSAVPEDAVVHSPTTVLGTAPAAAVDQGPQAARPAAPQPQAAFPEPQPDVRPATVGADKDQPVPASLDLPEKPATLPQADTAAKPLPTAEETPLPVPAPRADGPAMPATPAVDDLAVNPGDDTPREENLFDLFDWDEDDAAVGEQAAPTDKPEMTEERTTDGDEGKAASPDDDAPSVPAKDVPAKDAPTEDGDAGVVEATAAVRVPDEPLRRWTDSTGDHHAQGWLVEIRDGEARILKVSGRHTTMALADLSTDDQTYVAAVAARLAAGRPAAAAASDTAGL